MRPLLLLLALPGAGCLDFSLLATPPDAGGAIDLSTIDLDPCFNPTGGPSECSANNECVTGLCLSQNGPGQCVAGCATDGECSCPGSLCVAPSMGADLFCSRLCDLVAQTGCPKGMACDISRDGLRAFTYCRDDGTVATGDSCVGLECLAGNLCLSTPETCARWCHVGVPTDCTGMEKCKSLSNPAKINGVLYGVCSL